MWLWTDYFSNPAGGGNKAHPRQMFDEAESLESPLICSERK